MLNIIHMGNLVEVLSKSDKFKALTDVIKVAGLIDMLSSSGPYTLLAPTDSAFARSPRSTISNLVQDVGKLKIALLNHVIDGMMDSKSILDRLNEKNSIEIKTIGGAKFTFRNTGILKRHLTINGATIVSVDLPASNGVIHTIDKILLKNSI